MRVLFVAPFYDPAQPDPRTSLGRFPIFRELPAEMRARGHAVRVAALGTTTASATHAGVRYDWLAPAPPMRLDQTSGAIWIMSVRASPADTKVGSTLMHPLPAR